MWFRRPSQSFSRAAWSTTVAITCMLMCVGCGTIREQRATNQLLLSDAVDRAVADIDFSPLSEKSVYLDPRFLQFKNDSAVTTNYVISSLRQQMIVAGCLLQDSIDKADYVVEARIGTMGADGHDMNYGVPASSSVNAAATVIGGSAPLPVLPEISLARRTHDLAAVKIAAFAYERESREPLWQSGTSLAKSEATGTWILGAGPFKQGSIYEGTEFAGRETLPSRWRRRRIKSTLEDHDFVYRRSNIWDPELERKVMENSLTETPFETTAPIEFIADADKSTPSKELPPDGPNEALPDDIRMAKRAAREAAVQAAEAAVRQ